MANGTTDLPRRLAVQRSVDLLQPHADDDTIADVIERLLPVVGGETEDGGEAVEKAMLDMLSIEKSDNIAPEVKARARAARGQLGAAYLSRQATGAYTEPARLAEFEQVRKVEQVGALGDLPPAA